ncbi:MAG: hypothetical protein IKW80_10280, partial [Thermoguttaceae bacterium]|nr:hypothetical protein [Thermoguttaceae bacterium]
DKLYGLDDPMMRQFYEHMKNDPERRKKLKGSKREMYNRLAFLDMQEQKKAAVEKKYADKEAKEAEEKKKAEQDAIESQARIDELVAKGTGKSTKLIQLEREHNDLYNNKWLNDEWQENTPDAERNKTHKRMMAVRQAIKEEQAKLKEQSGVTEAENKVNGLQDAINHKYASGDYTGIDELKKQLEAAKLELAKTVANVSGKAREEARAELNKQRAEYKTLSEKDGVSEDELAEKWKKVEEAEANYKTQDSKYSSAVGEIQAAQEERANNQISQAKQTIETATSQGTFSAWETGSIGNSTAKEQLITMKKMLDELIGINKNTEEGAVTA